MNTRTNPHKPRRTHLLLCGMAGLALIFTGCSNAIAEPDENNDVPAWWSGEEDTNSDTDTDTDSDDDAPASDDSAAEGCEDVLFDDAFAEGTEQLEPAPRVLEWDTDSPAGISADSFDPCEELSILEVGVEGATDAAPFTQMAFHYGEYVGTIAPEPYSGSVSVDRTGEGVMEVGYSVPKEGEPSGGEHEDLPVEIVWDEDAEEVLATGEFPDGTVMEDGEVVEEPDELGADLAADECQGNPKIPSDADSRVCESDPSGAKQLPLDEEGSAVVQTPTENLSCTMDGMSNQLNCTRSSPEEKNTELGTNGPAADSTGMSTGEHIAGSPVVLDYGDLVTWNDYACASSEEGLSCWNTETKHGLHMSRAQVERW